MPKDGSKPPRRRLPIPVHTAVEKWVDTLTASGVPNPERLESWKKSLVEQAPKRYTVYEPMLLLPQGSFATDLWVEELRRQSQESLDFLWRLLLEEVGSLGKKTNILTHLAINEGIPLTSRKGELDVGNVNDEESKVEAEENILRSPSGMKLLYGDFGLVSTPPPSLDSRDPGEEGFAKALWVSTKQNGVNQTWAPIWTMFSRGNVKEKARLMGFPTPTSALPASASTGPIAGIHPQWAVDLYAGIGYFTFSYASMGFRVLCWEINPWSVEGLRRGAGLNGWSVKIVQGKEELERPTKELVAGGERIIVFLEDNQKALGRIRELRALEEAGW